MSNYVPKCEFCGSRKIHLPEIGISFGMYGENFSFCYDCLSGMTADQFWEEIFKIQNYAYPPKLTNPIQEGIDNGISPDEVMYPSAATKTVKHRKAKKPVRNERQKMTNALRYEVLKRDRFSCVACGVTGKDAVLHIDHIHPIAKGGKTTKENLQTLCSVCNSGKGVKL